MEAVLQSVSPLSTFMWDSPHAELVPPGFTPGSVADAMLHISDLTLRFDVLAKSVDYSFHPVRRAMESHPIHTRALHKRQFDVMRYGMVLDEVERLVLVPMPQLCGDTGVKVSHEYAAIFGGNFNEAPCAAHPILPEYCFVVYQLPESGNTSDKTIPTALFRMVFRNESFNEHVKMHLVRDFPLFRLRSVYVSHKQYYSLQRQLELYAKASASSESLPDRALEDTLGISGIRRMFDAWLMVLEGIAPAWLEDKGVGPDIVTLFLASHRPVGKYDVKETLEAYTQLPMDNRVRCSYYATGERMRQRVYVMQRFPDMINKWRQGAYDIRYFGQELTGPEPIAQVAHCIRMLLCRRKPGINYIEDDEIAAFVPRDDECAPLQVYNTLAAERLRLWVLKGLLTAELHGVHCLMLEFDTAMVVSMCVGLLWGSGEEDRQEEVVFHVCKIIVETVEDYVQHSGIIWQVIIVTSDENSLKSSMLCREILEVTQMAKTRIEIEERQRISASKGASSVPSDAGVTVQEEAEEVEQDEDENKKARRGEEKPPAAPLCEKRAITTAVLAMVKGATFNQGPFDKVGKFSESIRERAARSGVRISDAELYPIFLAISAGEETVLISDVVQLILEKELEASGSHRSTLCRETRLLWPHDHPICALDSCGVPCNETVVWNFVKSFQRRPYRAKAEDYRATIGQAPDSASKPPETLSYVEFSLMMLALARQ
ncbi:putative paraflagellar rod component [Trypanosoma rangeli]|uniref:Putative paraflagellar rod component n=1 Tax=Trypanosoma rangeli TaxID=5698 RepID=A0A3R7K3C1_TRYRA|nr:putative paraflagellar rod component [Trypanosoma rangeli]RNE99726.1 putative paraflagellar rod component [Trypanosoma rangeli]|eukprot:RNE99726.1 putative paraflagellar rod component [Trypanosoma rangeli]